MNEQTKFKFLARYIDLVVTGLISFMIVISVVYLLKYLLNFDTKWLIVFSFIIAISISPFVSKIKIGAKISQKYLEFLQKKFKNE